MRRSAARKKRNPQVSCPHDRCEAAVNINRNGGLSATLRVVCRDCGQKFAFMDRTRNITASGDAITIPMVPLGSDGITTTTPPPELSE